MIYLEPIKNEYMALKAEKQRLIESGQYHGEARKNIARKFGHLLSYPEDQIERLLSKKINSILSTVSYIDIDIL